MFIITVTISNMSLLMIPYITTPKAISPYPRMTHVGATITLYSIGRPVRATITLYPIGRPVR